jgi:hypothetical protein
MAESLRKNGDEPLEVQARIDQELVRHIHRLVKSDPQASALPFSFSRIAILLLLLERESEIQAFPESSTQRYTQNEFLSDCIDIGIRTKDDLMASFQDLVVRGFVDKGPDQRCTPNRRATEMIAVLSRIFPGISGVDLVAYMVQTITEVTSRRKSIEDAISHFDQTLSHHEIPLSESGAFTEALEPLDNGDAREKLAAEEKKRTYLKQMAEIRSRGAGDPAVVTVGGFSGPISIRELFPRPQTRPGQPSTRAGAGPSDSEPDARQGTKPGIPESEPVTEPETDARFDAPPVESQKPAPEPGTGFGHSLMPEIHETPLAPAGESEMPARGTAEPMLPVEACPPKPVFEAPPLVGPQTPLDAQALQHPRREPEATNLDILSEEDVESQIEALAQSLALSCPLCQAGTIKTTVTQRGKRYYCCSSPACRFVSWGLPYHYPCPLCQNPFLIEYRPSDGQPGLKCPRATCSYRQSHLGAPEGFPEKAGTPAAPTPKKQKVVRRRVVRRRK